MRTPKLSSITNTGDNLGKWVEVCKKESVSSGEMYSFDHQDKKILITNYNDKIFAIDRICTHAHADLSTGFLNEEGVRCPLHLSVFNLETGTPKNPPAEEPLKTYKTKIDQNKIFVEV